MSADTLFRMRVDLGESRLERAMAAPTLAIQAYDANRTDPHTGHQYIDVRARLYYTDDASGKRRYRTIFKRGATWCGVNRWTSLDGKEARELVLSLLSMKPGDTDPEYFASYTPAQLAFASRYGEELDMVRMDRFGDS
jgi:hypothetical protein